MLFHFTEQNVDKIQQMYSYILGLDQTVREIVRVWLDEFAVKGHPPPRVWCTTQ